MFMTTGFRRESARQAASAAGASHETVTTTFPQLEKRFESHSMISVSEVPHLGEDGKTALKGLARSFVAAGRRPETIIRAWRREPVVSQSVFGFPQFEAPQQAAINETISRGWFIKLGIAQHITDKGPLYYEGSAMLTPDGRVGSICRDPFQTGSVDDYLRAVDADQVAKTPSGEPAIMVGNAVTTLWDYPYNIQPDAPEFRTHDEVVANFVIDELVRLDLPWVQPS